MAGQRASGKLAWDLSINDAGALRSLRTIAAEVRATDNTWKAQETTLRSNGQQVEALQAKIDGLNDVVKLQKDYNEKLNASLEKAKQTKDTDTRTYEQWSAKMSQGTSRLAKQQAELDRASQAMVRYKTNIVEATNEHKASEKETKSNIDALKAEGNATKANSVQSKAYKNRVSDLKDELSREQKALKEMTSSGKDNTIVVKDQETRINKLRTSLSLAKDAQHRFALGLDDISQKNKNFESITSSFVDKLKAQGRVYKSQAVELKTLKTDLIGLNTQYRKEQDQLSYVKDKFGQTSKQYADQATKVNQLGSKIAKTNSKTQKLSNTVGKMSNKMIKTGDRLTMLKGKLDRTGSALIALSKGAGAVSLGLGYMVKNGITQETRLQRSFVKSKNLLVTSNDESTGHIVKNMGKMKTQARSLSIEYGQSQYKIAQAQQELIKRGYTSNETIAAMKPLLQAAASSGDSLNDVMRVSTSALESFGMRTDNAGKMVKNTTKAVNEMAYASDMTSSNFADTGIAMSYVGATAHTAGVKMSETAAAIGILSNNGLEADKSGTGLRKTITSLISPTSRAKAMLDQYNIKLEDSKGKLLPISKIFKEFHERLSGLSKVKQMNIIHTIFGQTGQAAAAVLVDNADKLKKLNDQVARSNKLNYVQRLSKKNMQNAETQEKRFKQAFNAVEIELAKDFLPAITKLSTLFAGVLDKIGKMSPLTKKIIDIVAIGLPTIATFSGFFGLVFKNVQKIYKSWVGFKSFFTKSSSTQDDEITEQTVLINKQIDAVERLADAWTQVNSAQDGGGVSSNVENDVNDVSKDASKDGNVVANVEKDAKDGSKIKGIAKEAKVADVGIGSKIKSAFRWGKDSLSDVLTKAHFGFAGLFGHILSVAAWGSTLFDVFKNASTVFKDGIDSKKGGSSVWKLAGMAVGGGIGAFFGPGAALIGSQIGEGIFSWVHKHSKNFKVPTKSSQVTDPMAKQVIADEERNNPRRSGNHAFESNLNSAEKRIPKQVKTMASRINAELEKSTMSFDSMAGTASNKAIKGMLSHNSSIYKSILSQERYYASRQEKRSKSDIADLASKGFMDKNEEKLALKREKANYNNAISGSKSSLKKLAAVDKQFGREMESENSEHNEALARTNKKFNNEKVSLEKKRNSDIAKLTRGYYVKYHGQYLQGESGILKIKKAYAKKIASAQKEQNRTIRDENKRHLQVMTADERAADKKRLSAMMKAEGQTSLVLSRNSATQKRIMNKLKKDSGHISDSMASKLISNSYKAMKSSIKNADNTYRKTVKSAQNKRNKVVKEAQEEYFVNHTINKRQYNDIVGSANDTYHDTVSAAEQQRKGVAKKAKQQHKQVVNQANKQSSDLHTITGKQVGGMERAWEGFKKSMGKIWNSVWGGIKGFLGNIGKSLNKSFKAQNKSFGQYGGNGKTLSYVPEKYATGTGLFSGSFRRAITKPTLAVLNDGNDSPETGNKETLIHPDGKAEVVQGRNTLRMLEPGTEIANATETKILNGMGLVHFAKGTGIFGSIGSFFSGIMGSLKKKLKALSSIAKNSASSWKDVFNPKPNSLKGDFSKNLFSMYKNKLSDQGSKWWDAAWNVMKNASGSGGASGNWNHTPGGNLHETDGFGDSRASMYGAGAKHDGVDFSGPLGSAIHAVHGGTVVRTGGVGISDLGDVIIVRSSDGYDEIYQEFGNMHNIKVKDGDTVHTGDTIATLGTLNGAGSGSHVHIGVTRGNPLKKNMLSTNGWFDVTKMKGHSSGASKDKSKNDSPLQKFVTKQLKNSGVLGWIKKHLAPLWNKLFGNVGSVGLSGSEKSRVKELAAAIRKIDPLATKAGIAAILGNWAFESGLNPGIQNSIGASGLGQWLGGRKTALMNYARRHHTSWKNAGTQLDFAFHGDGANSAILKRIIRGHGSVASLAAAFSNLWERGGATEQHVSHAERMARYLGYENGGLVTQHQLAEISEKNKPEMILPLTNKMRTVQLAKEALEMVTGNDAKQPSYEAKEQNKQNEELIKQNKTIISLLKLLVSASQNPVQAIVSGSDVVNSVNKHVRKKRMKQNLGRGVPLNEQ